MSVVTDFPYFQPWSPILFDDFPNLVIKDIYSRKVFIGGLPPDIKDSEIFEEFRKYGNLIVDWPYKTLLKSRTPPKGFAFLIYLEEVSVRRLVASCSENGSRLYHTISSATKEKRVQVRPWLLSDADFFREENPVMDHRKTIFMGGIPRALKAVELALIMHTQFGGVQYVGIDTGPKLKYPKGAARVLFSHNKNFLEAVETKWVHIKYRDMDKVAEVKPFILNEQNCDECSGGCTRRFAPFFCCNTDCLQYYCEFCWTVVHSLPGKKEHQALSVIPSQCPST